MTFVEAAILLVVAALLGKLAQRVLGHELGGWVLCTVLGFLGAVLGKELAGWFHLPVDFRLQIGDRSFPILWAILGALLVTVLFGAVAGRSSKRRKKKG
jgi:uncharacterized membrane protein YeaQ/YmgE (transglycosylase-associated protein family)